MSLLLTMNRFHTLFWFFYCWLWTSKYRLGIYLLIPISFFGSTFSLRYSLRYYADKDLLSFRMSSQILYTQDGSLSTGLRKVREKVFLFKNFRKFICFKGKFQPHVLSKTVINVVKEIRCSLSKLNLGSLEKISFRKGGSNIYFGSMRDRRYL